MDFPNNTVRQVDWDSFGEVNLTVDTVENNLRFPGQYYDSETGFYYNFHRYYMPEVGRYLREDEVRGKWDFNLYVYVGGNPVMNVDNRGELSWGDLIDGILCFRCLSKAADCAKKCRDEWEKCKNKCSLADCIMKWKKRYGLDWNCVGDSQFIPVRACYIRCMRGTSCEKCADFLWSFGFLGGF